jgi:hypothetical protein
MMEEGPVVLFPENWVYVIADMQDHQGVSHLQS